MGEITSGKIFPVAPKGRPANNSQPAVVNGLKFELVGCRHVFLPIGSMLMFVCSLHGETGQRDRDIKRSGNLIYYIIL